MLERRTFLHLAAAALLAGCRRSDEGRQAQSEAKGLDRASRGTAAPDVELRNSDDELASLAEATGKPLLINLWASWCAPCVKELPTLQALSQRAGAPRVLAISQDMAPRGSVDAFTAKLDLTELEVWHDPKMALSGALGTQVLPTTILYDARGREVWRYVGDLDWSGDEAAKLLAEAG
jgi:thiol-disulfide isomerase/thioredoxin